VRGENSEKVFEEEGKKVCGESYSAGKGGKGESLQIESTHYPSESCGGEKGK